VKGGSKVGRKLGDFQDISIVFQPQVLQNNSMESRSLVLVSKGELFVCCALPVTSNYFIFSYVFIWCSIIHHYLCQYQI